MIAVALIALLGATPLTDNLAPYRGQPVLSIDIDAPPDEDLEFLRSLIDIQPGYLLSTSQLQEAIKRIYALGRFTNVEVSAQRQSGVVLLRFHLRPIRRLENLELEGLNWAEEAPLRAALKLRPGAEVNRRTPELLEALAEEHLAAVGFPNAQATVETLEPEPNAPERSFRLRIIEALPRWVAAIRFTGAPRVHRSVLQAIISTRAGDILNLKRLARDRGILTRSYLDHGFLRARVDEPRIQSVGDVHTVIFNIDGGDRIAVEIAGNRSVTEADLRTLWPSEGVPLDGETLSRFAAAIADRYRRRGFADVKVDIRGFRDADHGITRYLFVIEEGEPVRVTRIEFSGAEAIPAATLEEQVRAVLRDELRVGADFEQITSAELEQAALGKPEYGERRRSAGYLPGHPPEERWVPDLFTRALGGIVAVYRDRGYLEAEVGEPILQRQGNELQIRIEVSEGPQTRINSIRFNGNRAIPAAELLFELEYRTAAEERVTEITPGGPFSASAIETGRITLVRRYRDLGYLYASIFAEASPATDPTGDARVEYADLFFRIEEGPQVRIRNVLVRGNRHTDVDTIRSQISLEPGDIYRLDQAVRDQRNVSRLGVFDSVRVELIDAERPAEQKDLVAEVSERDRHAFESFFGLSTADGVRAGITYSHNNLFGYAASLTLEARFNREIFFELYGDYRDTIRKRYDEYSTLDHFTKGIERTLHAGIRSRRFAIGPVGTALRLDFINEQDNTVAYTTHRTALGSGVELYPTERFTTAVETEVALTDAECPDTEESGWCRTGDTGDLLPEGVRVAFEIGPTLTFDLRDDQFRPTSGFWLKANATYAIGELWPQRGPRSDPFSIAKVETTAIGYLPLFGPVLVLTARAGHIFEIEGEVPIDERFYIGGRETLRGYVEKAVIPDDACVGAVPSGSYCPEIIEKEPPLTRGGKTYILLRSELRIDLTESFSVDIFVDIGNLWVEIDRARRFRPRIGIGAGLRYNTAVGAVVLDFGFNPSPRIYQPVSAGMWPSLRSYEPIFEPHFSVSRF